MVPVVTILQTRTILESVKVKKIKIKDGTELSICFEKLTGILGNIFVCCS